MESSEKRTPPLSFTRLLPPSFPFSVSEPLFIPEKNVCSTSQFFERKKSKGNLRFQSFPFCIQQKQRWRRIAGFFLLLFFEYLNLIIFLISKKPNYRSHGCPSMPVESPRIPLRQECGAKKGTVKSII